MFAASPWHARDFTVRPAIYRLGYFENASGIVDFAMGRIVCPWPGSVHIGIVGGGSATTTVDGVWIGTNRARILAQSASGGGGPAAIATAFVGAGKHSIVVLFSSAIGRCAVYSWLVAGVYCLPLPIGISGGASALANRALSTTVGLASFTAGLAGARGFMIGVGNGASVVSVTTPANAQQVYQDGAFGSDAVGVGEFIVPAAGVNPVVTGTGANAIAAAAFALPPYPIGIVS